LQFGWPPGEEGIHDPKGRVPTALSEQAKQAALQQEEQFQRRILVLVVIVTTVPHWPVIIRSWMRPVSKKKDHDALYNKIVRVKAKMPFTVTLKPKRRAFDIREKLVTQILSGTTARLPQVLVCF
jgi:hypothetical protein